MRGRLPGAREDARRRWWLASAAAVVLAAATWLRLPAVPYLLVTAAATTTLLTLTAALRQRGAWVLGMAATAVVFALGAARAQYALGRMDRDWPQVRAALEREATARLVAEIDATIAQLRTAARAALDAPVEPASAFAFVESLLGGTAERGIVLLRDDRAVAWAGRVRVALDHMEEPIGATLTPFFVEVHASARRGGDVAIATALLHADPPASRLSLPLDQRFGARFGFDRFLFGVPGDSAGGGIVYRAGALPLLAIQPPPLELDRMRLRELERARQRGGLLLALLVVLTLAAAWHQSAPLSRRLLALAVALATVAIVPLNSYSSASRLFDPAIYFAPLGGPYTASVAALAITGALLLLGLLAVLRSRARLASRPLALLMVLAIAALGPFLLRDLARGIAPPAAGVTVGIWLAWEVTIFLAGVSVLLAGATVGRVALGGRRGLHPAAAPTVAAVAALLAPELWSAPGRWPGWYPVLWVVAIGALAFTRRARGFVLTAAVVSATGAATLVWGTTARKRVELAQRDVLGLSTADSSVMTLLARFAGQLGAEDPPVSRGELLASYVRSDLAASELPVALATWRTDTANRDLVTASFATAPLDEVSDAERAAVRAARRDSQPVVREAPGSPGIFLILAVPFPDGHVTSAVVAPRTRLIREDPFVSLIGLAPEAAGEPPYVLSLTRAGARDAHGAEAATPTVWTRYENEVHGDFLVATARGPARAHVEVELRPLDALVPRGALVVLLDLFVVALLWTLNALADGGFARWLRSRVARWTRSYRARLTLALFAFFVIPAVVFAAWSYRRLQEDDRRSRELLVRETLRSVATAADIERLSDASDRLGSPLLLYRGGALAEASDSLYLALAPVGRYLRSDVELSLEQAGEVTASRSETVGGTRALFGYRAASDTAGERVVLAAPARTDELALDRRRRDLGVLVAFATVLGALAALGLSGIAARQLARPIGALRGAALAIAAGEREPSLAEQPPAEFQPVFSAFRRMASDLAASEHALEEAQRRIAAVLRNVASGVIAAGRDGRVTLANPRADALVGMALPPGTALDRIGSPALTRLVMAFMEGDADEEEFDLELHDRQLRGRLTRLTRGAGGAVVTLDDITELARAQRVLAWGEMARQVAHEIKNPLTPIRLGVQHLRRARADRRQDFDRILDQNVGRILGEIDRLDEIARAFSRYGTVPEELPPGEPTDAAAVLRDVVALERLGGEGDGEAEGEREGAAAAERDTLPGGGVRWLITGAAAPAMAMARSDELREVLLNLLENARLAGSRRIEAGVRREDGAVAIAVEDDGEGIAPSVLPRIFEPHFSTRTSGSGLGLATSRRIVESWGGAIEVTSALGEGTRVVVRLRAAEA